MTAPVDNADCLTPEAYQSERKLILDLLKENTDQHDKAILTLTAGIMGLTITFISNIAPNPSKESMFLLVVGWGGLIASLATMMLSFLTGQMACHRQVELLDKQAREGVRPTESNWMSWLTVRLNVGSYFLFVIGIIFVSAFSAINLLAGREPISKEGQMAISPQIPNAPPSPPPSNPGTGHTPPATPPVVPITPPPTKK